ncbi:GntR family transcriptional regulator [Peptoniphilus equinus]|uniref:GntR family transcriptional regulator n=1 Tax=Peptoniphilus equinus TaxID=3016343 RepID=A0ABY7QVQ4_9FIRM|nr:GntR family transcriptional regulator [Peptoniphilus equinus]WBW50174.1 GntR family transcriptional regulator [Peptoniphilus equinus]
MKRQTLSEKAYHYIRTKIIEGEFDEGDLLTESSIGEELNMSRTPVRQAFIQLESENYLKSFDGVGTLVKGLSIKDLSDIYEIRSILEVNALKTSIERIHKKELIKLRDQLQTYLDEYQKGYKNALKYISKLDSVIHELIVEKSSNNYYKLLLNQISSQVERYRFKANAITNTTVESTAWHITILNAMIDDDLETAQAALKEHIAWSLKQLIKTLYGIDVN